MPIRARWALAGAAGCVMLIVATWFAAFHIPIFHKADLSTYLGFVGLHHHGAVDAVAGRLVWLCNPRTYVLWAPVAVVLPFLRGRPRVAIGAGAILLGANVTTELLKRVAAPPEPSGLLGGWLPVPATSWPSGHTTAAMAVILCLMLASPGRLRPFVAALGAAFAVAIGYSVVATGMHFPSDVFAGYLVATTWALVVVAALSAAERRWPTGATVDRVSIRAALAPQAAVIAAAVVLAGLMVLSHPHDVFAYSEAHKQLVAVAAAIATLGVSLSTATMLSLRAGPASTARGT